MQEEFTYSVDDWPANEIDAIVSQCERIKSELYEKGYHSFFIRLSSDYDGNIEIHVIVDK